MPSFFEIDQGPLMQGTVWLKPDLQAFCESLIKPRGAEKFPGPWRPRHDPHVASPFVWDMGLHGSSEDMFKEHFQRIHVE